MNKLTPRQYLILLLDAVAVAFAISAALLMRFDGWPTGEIGDRFEIFLPLFVIYAAGIFFIFKLHKNKWRFTSVPDLFNIVRASTVLALSLVALDYILLSPNVYGSFFFGKVTILLYWMLQISFLGAGRISYRYMHYAKTWRRVRVASGLPVLFIGRTADAEVLIRAIESGAVKSMWPVGILSPSRSDRWQSIRSIPVLGDVADLEQVAADLEASGTPIKRIVMAQAMMDPEVKLDSILIRARRLGIALSQLPSLDSGPAVQLRPVAVEDLLLRPSAKIDYHLLERYIKGRSIVVTGGGGSIGSELCERVITLGAARLLIIENSEPALHAITERIKSLQAEVQVFDRIADIRDRARIMHLISEYKPEVVFHAAALKHVPLLERDCDEAVKTNVFGSVNVADAAAAAGAKAMVMISTDKAIEPVSVLGATKRLAEMYCDALDSDLRRQASPRERPAMRLISVRFGNVLASNGSVVPKFKTQIAAGGPVTVTHPDMVRYFMTIREACDLVLIAASHAENDADSKASIYVLNMGHQVKIVDLAERMIRLSGLEPSRDIEITFTGVRPGERLHEMLFADGEEIADIGLPGIVAARPNHPSLESIRAWLRALEDALVRNESETISDIFCDAIPEFRNRGTEEWLTLSRLTSAIQNDLHPVCKTPT